MRSLSWLRAFLIHGTRPSLVVGFGATVTALLLGGLLGSTAALRGGLLDVLIVRIADVAACYMNCQGNQGGTAIADFITGKQSYFDAHAPGTTIIESMNFFANGIWPTYSNKL